MCSRRPSSRSSRPPSPRALASTPTSTTSTPACQPGAISTRRSATHGANTSTQGDTPNRLLRTQPEKVTVTDPAHPLFRREFVLATIRGSVVNGQAVVVYRGDVVLRVPIRATSLDLGTPPLPTGKLSLAAIRDLVR